MLNASLIAEQIIVIVSVSPPKDTAFLIASFMHLSHIHKILHTYSKSVLIFQKYLKKPTNYCELKIKIIKYSEFLLSFTKISKFISFLG